MVLVAYQDGVLLTMIEELAARAFFYICVLCAVCVTLACGSVVAFAAFSLLRTCVEVARVCSRKLMRPLLYMMASIAGMWMCRVYTFRSSADVRLGGVFAVGTTGLTCMCLAVYYLIALATIIANALRYECAIIGCRRLIAHPTEIWCSEHNMVWSRCGIPSCHGWAQKPHLYCHAHSTMTEERRQEYRDAWTQHVERTRSSAKSVKHCEHCKVCEPCTWKAKFCVCASKCALANDNRND